jgi:hypothetical protein
VNWIPVSKAAALMGYKDVSYFRRIFCDPQSPILTIRVRYGPKGQRSIKVLEASVLDQIQREVKSAS